MAGIDFEGEDGRFFTLQGQSFALEFCDDSECVYVFMVHEAMSHLSSYLGLTPRLSSYCSHRTSGQLGPGG